MKNYLFIALFVSALILSGCNVTRTITTQCEYIKESDKSTIIQTKTIETYDASKKL